MRVAVVGHHEWVEFARVDHVPQPGEIVHSLERWEEAAGGGAVAAVQLAKLGGDVTFFTVFGNDDLGRRARKQLTSQGVKVRAVVASEPQRRAFTYIDSTGERTITVLGHKLRPGGGDSRLPWNELAGVDAVYFVSGDAQALEHARRARVVVASARDMGTLREAGLQLDAIVGSSEDSGERYEPGELEPPPHLVVATAGPLGGWARPGGPFRALPVPGEIEDTYGCGDCFAAGLTYALGEGRGRDEALELAARCGAAVLTGRGAYAGQLEL